MAIVTSHAKRRTRKRLGIPKKSATANANRAFELGFRMTDTKSALWRYLDGVKRQCTDDAEYDIVVYHRAVYIFSNEILVTVFQLPRKYHNVADTIERRINAKNRGYQETNKEENEND